MRNKLLLLLITLTLFCFCSNSYAWEIAIFDYDDRFDRKDTVAKYIGKSLNDAYKYIKIEHYTGKGNKSIAIETLKKIDQSGYDLIITVTSDALILAQTMLTKTPVIYTNVNNPLFLGFDTLDAPGGNISGASYYVPIKNQISLFRQIQPDIKKLGFIFDQDNKSMKVETVEVREVCEKMGIEYELVYISKVNELPEKANRLVVNGANAIIVTTSGKIVFIQGVRIVI